MSDDRSLLRRLRVMWETTDPVPPDLADLVLFRLQAGELEYELLRLEPVLEPTGTRGVEEPTTVTFSSTNLTLMISVSGPVGGRRLDGWIAPPRALRVELRSDVDSEETVADEDGRFAFTLIPEGRISLLVHPRSGPDSDAGSCRPVVTPPIRF